jgi:hypothetical protein
MKSQIRYMVAAATVFHSENRVSRECDTSKNTIMLLVTVFLHRCPLGWIWSSKQFSSCVLIRSDDDLDSIFASGE